MDDEENQWFQKLIQLRAPWFWKLTPGSTTWVFCRVHADSESTGPVPHVLRFHGGCCPSLLFNSVNGGNAKASHEPYRPDPWKPAAWCLPHHYVLLHSLLYPCKTGRQNTLRAIFIFWQNKYVAPRVSNMKNISHLEPNCSWKGHSHCDRVNEMFNSNRISVMLQWSSKSHVFYFFP